MAALVVGAKIKTPRTPEARISPRVIFCGRVMLYADATALPSSTRRNAPLACAPS
jgi:hypothetical protein